jgi:hypothetical protein
LALLGLLLLFGSLNVIVRMDNPARGARLLLTIIALDYLLAALAWLTMEE